MVALDTETNHRLSTANSVNNITNNGDDNEQEDDIGRIAGWAVNFNKLLNDHGGLAVFTVSFVIQNEILDLNEDFTL